jgi:hypothetical protein
LAAETQRLTAKGNDKEEDWCTSWNTINKLIKNIN